MTRHRPAPPRARAVRWAGGVALGALVLAAAPPPASAQQAPAPAALGTSVITPPQWPYPGETADSGEEHGQEAVRLREAVVREGALAPICGPSEAGREARFPLFDDTVVEVAEKYRETIDGNLVWHGEVEGTGDQTVIVTLSGGCDDEQGNEYLSAHFMLGGSVYDISPDGPGRVTVSEVTPVTDEDDHDPVPPMSRPAAPPAPDKSRAPRAKCKGSAKIAVIDTLVAYSPKARTEAGGDSQMKTLIAKAVSLANDAFATSDIDVRVRLVGTSYVSVPAAYDTQSGASLLAFASGDDGVVDTLPTLRDKYGADQVSVITGGSAMGGIGYTPEQPGPSWADWAYTVVARNAITHYSFAHEIGHNLGANHDWTTEPSQPNNGAAGYFPKKGDWSTVMAYESSCRTSTKGSCGRINRFSNGTQKYRGEKLGTSLTATHAADSSQFFETSGKAVAAYRTAKTDDSLCAVTTSVSPKGKGSVTPETKGPYAQNAKVYFTAKAAKGYVFNYWTLDGKKQSSKSTKFQVSIASKDHTLKATFKKGTTAKSSVSTKTSGSGTVKSTKSAKRAPVAEGTTLLYEAVPAAGWSFAGWRLDGSYAGDDDDIHLEVGEDDSELTAVFEPHEHGLDVRVEGGEGTIALSQPGPYAEGDTVHATADPADGFVFVDWLLDGEPYGGDESRELGETAVSFADDRGHTLTALLQPE
ncbi:reprolysin-like metallopeptidase [Streptomyces sp. NPDC050803]|uniref:InlB B-repeat-containing protein n=1 Tax=unclassified Streptomyces TaxID=2593676 RepID=UPI00342AA977